MTELDHIQAIRRHVDALTRIRLHNQAKAGKASIYSDITELVQGQIVEAALVKTRGNQTQAAKKLGIARNSLASRIGSAA